MKEQPPQPSHAGPRDSAQPHAEASRSEESALGVSVIAEEVRIAARSLAEGSLAGKTIERAYAADDRFVEPFLKAVSQGNEVQALGTLAVLLRSNPRLLEHPYVWGQFRHLFTVFHPLFPEMTDQAQEQLVKLIEAWAEGMTIGWKVSITKPATGRRGQAPQYFPHLHDRDGWLPTEQAIKERQDAEEFVRVYDALKTRLSKGVGWKSLRRRYGPSQHGPVYRARDLVEAIFKKFKRDEGISQPPLGPQRLMEIARTGLKEPKGRNPADRVARELLATLPWYTTTGAVLTLTPSGIKSTLETLRKKGIPRRGSST